MSPDPSHQSEERRVASEGSYATAVGVNQEQEDDISYEGYQMLPQDFNESNAELEDVDLQDSNSDEENSVSSTVTPSAFDQAVKIELKELWNSSCSNRMADIVMDSTKEEEIKSAMAGFKLPSTSIPLWAKNIPEDQWKQQILSRINSSNKT